MENNIKQKYVCAKCKQEISKIQYIKGKTICIGLFIKCPKCNNIIEIIINDFKIEK